MVLHLVQPIHFFTSLMWRAPNEPTRSQQAACMLYDLLQKSYLVYCSSLGEKHNQLSLEYWYSSRAELYTSSSGCLFCSWNWQCWSTWELYKREILQTVCRCIQIVLWFFALDHTNYARWIPVHLRDTVILKDVHPKGFERKFRSQEHSTQILCYHHWPMQWAEQYCSERYTEG